MSKPKITVKRQVTEHRTLLLSKMDIIQLLQSWFVEETIPHSAEVSVKVPADADFRGEDLDIDEEVDPSNEAGECLVKVSWKKEHVKSTMEGMKSPPPPPPPRPRGCSCDGGGWYCPVHCPSSPAAPPSS